MQKLPDLNYKIVDKKGKEFVVHINRSKKTDDQTSWSFENSRRPSQKTWELDAETLDGDVVVHSRPIAAAVERESKVVEMQALEEERLH